MSRNAPLEALSKRLDEARQVLREARRGSITASPHHELIAFITWLEVWATQAATVLEEDIEAFCFAVEKAREAGCQEGLTEGREEGAKILNRFLADAKQARAVHEAKEACIWDPEAPTEGATPQATRGKLPNREAAKRTEGLNFSAAETYTLEDKRRGIRLKITVENILETDQGAAQRGGGGS